ncbi:variable surface lipoprotein [Mycoplasmopsis maculosa]|uniref:Variable surface lipoprotein n=1 Tax=Mycoplasmopsis maculosa TaxID=114885 RepID=A0A449B3S2_9BACT|nr:variable surface lipoprotein [Mycoplasmopsis maculosa]VEU75253.1 variable surface lipoprotein [Mycoplasmopsis maculosa]
MKKNKLIYLGTLTTLTTIPFIAASCNMKQENKDVVQPENSVNPSTPESDKKSEGTGTNNQNTSGDQKESDKQVSPNKDVNEVSKPKVEGSNSGNDQVDKTEEEKLKEEWNKYKTEILEPKLNAAIELSNTLGSIEYLEVEKITLNKLIIDPLNAFKENQEIDNTLKTRAEEFISQNYEVLTNFLKDEKEKWQGIINLKRDDAEYPKYVKNIKLGANKMSTGLMVLIQNALASIGQAKGVDNEQATKLREIFNELNTLNIFGEYNDLFFQPRNDYENEPEVPKTNAQDLGTKEKIKELYAKIANFVNTSIGKFNEIMNERPNTVEMIVNASDYTLDAWKI